MRISSHLVGNFMITINVLMVPINNIVKRFSLNVLTAKPKALYIYLISNATDIETRDDNQHLGTTVLVSTSKSK